MPAMTPNFSEKRYLSSKEKTYSLSCRCRNLTDFYVLLHNCYDLNMNIDNLDIVKQLIAAKKPAEPPSDSSKDKLDRVPEFFHDESLLKKIFVYEKSGCPKWTSASFHENIKLFLSLRPFPHIAGDIWL